MHNHNKPNQTLRNPHKPNSQVKQIQDYSFNFNDRLGQGFTSTVFKGKNDATNEPVAIKVISKQHLQDPVLGSLLENEIYALKELKKLNSQNVLKLLEIYQSSNNRYIITEFCDGKDLESHIKQKGKLEENEAKRIMWQILQGFKQLDKLKIVHRDLKPANVFSNNGVYKIGDFGFALPAS